MLENGADVSRLTGVGLARDEAMRVKQRAREKGGGDNERYHRCQRSGGKNDGDARGRNRVGRLSSGECERDG